MPLMLAFFHRKMVLLFGLGRVMCVAKSRSTVPWSLFPSGGMVVHRLRCPGWDVSSRSLSLSLRITSYQSSGGNTSAVHILSLSQVSVPRMTSGLVDTIMTWRSLRLFLTLWKFATRILRFCWVFARWCFGFFVGGRGDDDAMGSPMLVFERLLLLVSPDNEKVLLSAESIKSNNMV